MKHIIILGDGMADHAIPELGGKTLLQYAHTPGMDWLARNGQTGMLKTVADGFHPGSEVANMSILGYDMRQVYEGRGVLEAASIGIDLAPDDLALRCNFVCIEGDLLKSHSAGNITDQESAQLIDYLQQELGNEQIHFYAGVSYRNLLIIKGGNKQLNCTPPHDIPLQPFAPNMIKADEEEAQATADLLNKLIVRSQQLLPRHPINLRRVSEGKEPANSIWPWSPGTRPKMSPLSTMFPQIKRGAVVTAVDLIRGIGRYAGLQVLKVEGATGLYDTNYENKTAAALQALKNDDFVFLHVEASDEAGHDGNLPLKLQTIENLDCRMVTPIINTVKEWDTPVAIALLPDHPTPCHVRTHTAEPVPFAIYYPGISPDSVQTFDEEACKQGLYPNLQGDQFIQLFMQSH